MKNRIKVESKDKDGNPIVLYVKKPDRKVYQKAQAISNRTFRDALDGGAILRSELDSCMRKRGLWDSEKQDILDKINKEIEDGLLQLKKGGIKLSEARSIAIKIRGDRMRRTFLMAQRNQLDDYSAESQSENDRFDFLVSECVVNEEGNRVFSTVDDYKEKSEETYVIQCATALSTMLYGLEENWESVLPENKFLKKYDFINDKLQLVNKEGKLVAEDGKRINENYQYINSENKPVDELGNLLDEDGLLVVDTSPFLDDDDNPILESKVLETTLDNPTSGENILDNTVDNNSPLL